MQWTLEGAGLFWADVRGDLTMTFDSSEVQCSRAAIPGQTTPNYARGRAFPVSVLNTTKVSSSKLKLGFVSEVVFGA